MKAMIDENGLRRINMKIEVAVGITELTAHALRALTATASEPVAGLVNCNKREIFALARSSIKRFGYSDFEQILQTLSAEQLAAAEKHVAAVFPELSK